MRRMIVLALAAALSGVATTAAAGGGLDLTGTLTGAEFEIRVPEGWDGHTLVVFAHGYRNAGTDVPAAAAPGEEFEEQLLAAGYAIAGSAYQEQGWSVKQAIQDTLALTNYFRGHVGNPDTIILSGYSMGSVVTFESIEKYPGIFAGAVPGCAVGAGAPRAFDGTLAISVAYDAVFGWPAAWGAPNDVRDDLTFAEVFPSILGAALTQPGKLEFVRRATGVPVGPAWPFSIWFFTTEGRAELERRAGGPVAQNLDHSYTLTAADRATIKAIDPSITDGMLDGWLAVMNAADYAPHGPARHFLEKYADYGDGIKRPVLALGTVVDALVPPAHMSKYQERVEAAGDGDLLQLRYTSGIGHCNFTPEQWVAAVDGMSHWIETGAPPDDSFFDPADGFVSFTPPPWPQP